MIGWTLGVIVLLVLLALARGTFELRRNANLAQASIANIRAADIEALCSEGARVLRERLQVELETEPEAAAHQLDVLTRSPRIKDAFATPELYWNFIRPLGALLGEQIRRNGQARWEEDSKDGLVLRVTLDDGRELTARPFDRVLRHRLSGRPGELKSYVLFASGKMPAPAQTASTGA